MTCQNLQVHVFLMLIIFYFIHFTSYVDKIYLIMMKITFPDHIDIDESSRKKLKAIGVQMYDDTPDSENVITERIKDAEIITANFIDITKKVIDTAPKLKYIISPAVGYEWIDYEYAASKGIKVLNCPTQNAEAVAEHAITLMLNVSRRITEANLGLQQGNWSQQKLTSVELSHKKLGLIGYGKIGKLIERKIAGFDMQVSYVKSDSSAKEIDDLLRTSDVVCLCLALNKASTGMIDERRLKLLKKESILVNIARAAIIDQAALVRQLKANAIRGAGIDVFLNEPFIGDAPNSIVEIAKLPNVVATPHIAYNTEETMQRLGVELFTNIESCINNDPINVINGY